MPRIQVFTQSVRAFIGKEKGEFYAWDRSEYRFIDVTQLYNELYERWCSLQRAGANETKCLDGEQTILARLGIHMPMDFEKGEHPLKDCSPSTYSDVLDDWLLARNVHMDHDEVYGLFTNGRYVLKNGTDIDGAVCIWPKEIYAAVFAARDGGDAVADESSKSREEWYEEYMTWSIDEFLERGI